MSLHHAMSCSHSIIFKLLTEKNCVGCLTSGAAIDQYSYQTSALIPFPSFLIPSGHPFLFLCFKYKQCVLLQCTTEMHQQATRHKFLLGKTKQTFQHKFVDFSSPKLILVHCFGGKRLDDQGGVGLEGSPDKQVF